MAGIEARGFGWPGCWFCVNIRNILDKSYFNVLPGTGVLTKVFIGGTAKLFLELLNATLCVRHIHGSAGHQHRRSPNPDLKLVPAFVIHLDM